MFGIFASWDCLSSYLPVCEPMSNVLPLVALFLTTKGKCVLCDVCWLRMLNLPICEYSQ